MFILFYLLGIQESKLYQFKVKREGVTIFDSSKLSIEWLLRTPPPPPPSQNVQQTFVLRVKKSFRVLPRVKKKLPRDSECFSVLLRACNFWHFAFLSFCISYHYFSTLLHTFSMLSTFSQQIASALTLLLS
jgi:hypothetical protein